MITLCDETIQKNKDRYIELVQSISRDGCNLDKLLTWLENSDFYFAPASAKYHAAIKGGLCWHSLHVYDNLVSLNRDWEMGFCEDTLKIVSLFHDLAKVNFYEIQYKNKKVYSNSGSKKDESGRFDWVSVSAYGYIDDSERFIYGNHESTSEYMIRQFIPLTYIESIAIMHHHAGMSFDSAKDNIGAIWSTYPLSLFLYIADSQAAFLNENNEQQYFHRVEIIPEEVNDESSNVGSDEQNNNSTSGVEPEHNTSSDTKEE